MRAKFWLKVGIPVIGVLALIVLATTGRPARVSSAASKWAVQQTGVGYSPEKVSCLSTSFCEAVGTGGTAVHYTGKTWNVEQVSISVGSMGGVSCASTTLCISVQQRGSTTSIMSYNGTSWSDVQDLTSTTPLSGVSCPSTIFCVVVGGSGKIFTSATPATAASWTQVSGVSTSLTLSAVSCVSSSFCVAVGADSSTTAGVILTSTSPTSTWAVVPASAVGTSGYPTGPFNSFSGVSCPNSSDCVVVGASCTPINACAPSPTGFAGTIVTTTNAGASWSLQQIGSNGGVEDVSCLGASAPAAITFCAAVGDNGMILDSSDGTNWAPQTNPTGIPRISLFGVSCVPGATTFCIALTDAVPGPPGAFLQFNGLTWSVQFLDIGLSGVSCLSTLFCEAAGEGGIEGFNGTSWSTQTNPATSDGNPFTLSSVSCVSGTPNFCAEVEDGVAQQFNGTSWSIGTTGTPTIPLPLDSVSCVSANFCWAVGGSHATTPQVTTFAFWNGASWAVSDTAAGGSNGSIILLGVSCVNTSFCIAVGQSGTIEQFGTSGWSTVSNTPNTNGIPLNSVSCFATNFCVAVGTFGLVEQWNGTSWSIVTTLPATNDTGQGSDLRLDSVACTSATFCVAVGGDFGTTGTNTSAILQFDGTNWTFQNSPTTNTLSGVSCTSTSFCVAVGGDATIIDSNGPTLTPASGTTTTTVACIPAQIPPSGQSACTATVTDISTLGSPPAGSIALFPGTFSGPSAGCTLANPVGASESCSVTLQTPSTFTNGTLPVPSVYFLRAAYTPSDATHFASGCTCIPLTISNSGTATATATSTATATATSTVITGGGGSSGATPTPTSTPAATATATATVTATATPSPSPTPPPGPVLLSPPGNPDCTLVGASLLVLPGRTVTCAFTNAGNGLYSMSFSGAGVTLACPTVTAPGSNGGTPVSGTEPGCSVTNNGTKLTVAAPPAPLPPLAIIVVGGTVAQQASGSRADVAGQSLGTLTVGLPNVSVNVSVNLGTAVTLASGWNLVGGTTGTQITGALSSLYTFQASDSTYESFPTSAALSGGVGVWAFFSSPTPVALPFVAAQTLMFALPVSHFIMAGNPTDGPVSLSGADVVDTFNTATNSYTSSTGAVTLQPGQGAWVFSRFGGTLTITPAGS